MSGIPSRLLVEVAKRADQRCEYCQLSQIGQEATFHTDHIIPRIVGGPTTIENLALACVSCSLRKSAKLTALDPESGAEVPLFNPRTQSWGDHFRWEMEYVVPLTDVGRATVESLAMNRSSIVAIRQEEALRGRHPP